MSCKLFILIWKTCFQLKLKKITRYFIIYFFNKIKISLSREIPFFLKSSRHIFISSFSGNFSEITRDVLLYIQGMIKDKRIVWKKNDFWQNIDKKYDFVIKGMIFKIISKNSFKKFTLPWTLDFFYCNFSFQGYKIIYVFFIFFII